MSNKKTTDDWKKEVQRLRNKLSRMQRKLEDQKADMARIERKQQFLEREVRDARNLSSTLSQLIEIAKDMNEREPLEWY